MQDDSRVRQRLRPENAQQLPRFPRLVPGLGSATTLLGWRRKFQWLAFREALLIWW